MVGSQVSIRQVEDEPETLLRGLRDRCQPMAISITPSSMLPPEIWSSIFQYFITPMDSYLEFGSREILSLYSTCRLFHSIVERLWIRSITFKFGNKGSPKPKSTDFSSHSATFCLPISWFAKGIGAMKGVTRRRRKTRIQHIHEWLQSREDLRGLVNNLRLVVIYESFDRPTTSRHTIATVPVLMSHLPNLSSLTLERMAISRALHRQLYHLANLRTLRLWVSVIELLEAGERYPPLQLEYVKYPASGIWSMLILLKSLTICGNSVQPTRSVKHCLDSSISGH